jgi:hypothetical protein
MNLTSRLLALLCLLPSAQVVASTLVVPALDTGWYSQSGHHDRGNPNYATGNFNGENHASFFIFQAPEVPRFDGSRFSDSTRIVRRPDLNLINRDDPGRPPDALYAYERRTERKTWTRVLNGIDAELFFRDSPFQVQTADGQRLHIWATHSPEATIRAGGHGVHSGRYIYGDLSGGTLYGSIVLPDAGAPFGVPLTQTAETMLGLAQGDLFSLGASLPGAGFGDYAFGFSQASADVELRISPRYRYFGYTEEIVGSEIFYSTDPALVPEPSTYALLALGGGAVFCLLRRRRS